MMIALFANAQKMKKYFLAALHRIDEGKDVSQHSPDGGNDGGESVLEAFSVFNLGKTLPTT